MFPALHIFYLRAITKKTYVLFQNFRNYVLDLREISDLFNPPTGQIK